MQSVVTEAAHRIARKWKRWGGLLGGRGGGRGYKGTQETLECDGQVLCADCGDVHASMHISHLPNYTI